MFVSVCFVAAGVLLLVFRGKILGYVRRRTTTEPFTKDVVFDHERRLGELKTLRYRHRLNHKQCRLDIFSSTFGGYYVCRLFTLSTMAEEEVTEVVADNGSGMCADGFAASMAREGVATLVADSVSGMCRLVESLVWLISSLCVQ